MPTIAVPDVQRLADGVLNQDRRAVARAVTLIESTRADHRVAADDLLNVLSPHAGNADRVGISGAPGVGKSTFIETLGMQLVSAGRKLAVLTVDPSSTLSGGSILGDKTRMTELSREPGAFIRPSPAGTSLGGVARRTREAMIVCEAAGFDLVFVETVGVGQSEVAVANMTDVFLLLLLPLGGDELQGIKRGIMELADVVLVNKADGPQHDAAQRTVAEYRNALHLMRSRTPGWEAVVEPCSALMDEGMTQVWSLIEKHQAHVRAQGVLNERRRDQAKRWFWDEISDGVLMHLKSMPGAHERITEYEALVGQGEKAAPVAARQLLRQFLG
ncbi:MAG: methylmalonyl Co-A mutase-associated GTPase MeaB [Gammaproteobacteria bacterium]|nr:methylmalonyl Co-A mutase-associated GTPase MeaB [Gammaproteobacteria bacterium]